MKLMHNIGFSMIIIIAGGMMLLLYGCITTWRLVPTKYRLS